MSFWDPQLSLSALRKSAAIQISIIPWWLHSTRTRSEDIPKPNGRSETFLLPRVVPEQDCINTVSVSLRTLDGALSCAICIRERGGMRDTQECYNTPRNTHVYTLLNMNKRKSMSAYVCVNSFYTASHCVGAPRVRSGDQWVPWKASQTV